MSHLDDLPTIEEMKKRPNGPLVYLAVPYSHESAKMREARFTIANIVAAHLMTKYKLNVFSPISHTHPIAVQNKLPLGFDFWRDYDEAFIRCSHTLFILQLAGWKESIGVTAEIELARQYGLTIMYVDFDCNTYAITIGYQEFK